MLRKLCLISITSILCGAFAIADDEKKTDPPKTDEKKTDDVPAKGKLGKLAGKMDKAKLFAKMDADGDGKLTKDEFKKAGETLVEKLKEKGKGEKAGNLFGDKLFDKLDANKDGTISKEEFEKFEFPGLDALKGKAKKEDPAEEKKTEEKKGDEKKEGKG